MPMNPEEKAAWALQAYGCSEAELREAIERSLSKMIFIMGCCSDAQELMTMALKFARKAKPEEVEHLLETARQYLNRAKFGMSEYLEVKGEKRSLLDQPQS